MNIQLPDALTSHPHPIFELAGLEKIAADLAACLPDVGWVALHGDLGAGKTTLVQRLLEKFGVKERVVSPTYSLVEPYTVTERQYFHIDLYRIEAEQDLGELDLPVLVVQGLCLIEWPSVAQKILPNPVASITIKHTNESTRWLTIE
jgi:tRNA threonylcarbamoyladenosine biosynthesis protein TsaE